MEELTLEKLKDMEPGIFARGKHLGTKWVAVRGSIWDWAIYNGSGDKTWEEVKNWGDKLFSEDIIRSLVPCTDKAWEWYRP